MNPLLIPFVLAMAFGGLGGPSSDGPVVALPSEPVATASSSAARAPDPQEPTGQFTTATEVKPILTATKPAWVAVRDYDGHDLLYFTNLLAWRCGLWEVSYGLNGAEPTEPMVLEPCHADTAQPNAMTQIEDFLPYLTFDPGSVSSVTVRIAYDDGTTDTATYDRKAILMP